MQALRSMTALFAAFSASLSLDALSQTPPQAPGEPAAVQSQASQASGPRVYHAGGPRHDQWAHEATLKARERGQRMQEPKVHPGGRHDQAAHEAALRAERAAENPAAK